MSLDEGLAQAVSAKGPHQGRLEPSRALGSGGGGGGGGGGGHTCLCLCTQQHMAMALGRRMGNSRRWKWVKRGAFASLTAGETQDKNLILLGFSGDGRTISG